MSRSKTREQFTYKGPPSLEILPHPAVISLTIKQLLSLKKDNEIQNQPFSTIILVAKLLAQSAKDNKRRVTFTDGTGVVTLIVLMGDEKNLIEGKSFEEMLGKYMFVACTPKYRREDKEWVYFLDKARGVENFNEISKHMSDSILSYLERTH